MTHLDFCFFCREKNASFSLLMLKGYSTFLRQTSDVLAGVSNSLASIGPISVKKLLKLSAIDSELVTVSLPKKTFFG